MQPKKKAEFERRDFVRMALAGTVGGGAFVSQASTGRAKVHKTSPGIKLSVQLPTSPSEEDLQFVRQLGVGYVNIPTRGEHA